MVREAVRHLHFAFVKDNNIGTLINTWDLTSEAWVNEGAFEWNNDKKVIVPFVLNFMASLWELWVF